MLLAFSFATCDICICSRPESQEQLTGLFAKEYERLSTNPAEGDVAAGTVTGRPDATASRTTTASSDGSDDEEPTAEELLRMQQVSISKGFCGVNQGVVRMNTHFLFLLSLLSPRLK